MLNDSPYCFRVPDVIADRVRSMGVQGAIQSLGMEVSQDGAFDVSFSSDFGPVADGPSRSTLLLWARALLGQT